jgi:hypothetical protein
VEVVAFAVQILELDLVQDRAVHEFFRAEPVIDNRTGAQVFHARLHRSALISRRPVLRAVDGIQIALMLDHHAGAKKCRFHAAHNFVRGRRAAVDSC